MKWMSDATKQGQDSYYTKMDQKYKTRKVHIWTSSQWAVYQVLKLYPQRKSASTVMPWWKSSAEEEWNHPPNWDWLVYGIHDLSCRSENQAGVGHQKKPTNLCVCVCENKQLITTFTNQRITYEVFWESLAEKDRMKVNWRKTPWNQYGHKMPQWIPPQAAVHSSEASLY